MVHYLKILFICLCIPIWFASADSSSEEANLDLTSLFDRAKKPKKKKHPLPLEEPKPMREPEEYFFGLGTEPQALSGGRSLASAYRLLSRTDDYLVRRVYDHEGRPKASAIALRLGRALLLDIPFARWSRLITHEVFGHGSKLREFGYDASGYSFRTFGHVPTGGTTHYDAETAKLSYEQEVAFRAGGAMANQATAIELEEDILSRDRVHWSYWPVWFMNKLEFTDYVSSTPKAKELEEQKDLVSHDMASYIFLTSKNGVSRSERRSQMVLAAAWNVLDPMAFAAVYNYVIRELIKGQAYSPNPMVKIGGYQFFAGTRAGLTPSSPELYLDLYMRDPKEKTLVKLAVRRGFDDEFGARLSLSNIPISNRVKLKLHGEFWQEREGPGEPKFGGFDAGGGLNMYLAKNVGLYAEGGYKTKGTVMGRPFDEGPYGEGGLILRY